MITKDYTLKKTAHPQNSDEGQGWTESETSDALNTFENTESRAGSVAVQQNGAVVRRLTPLECERLQGFPDGWTDIGEWTDTKGKKHKTADSSRYKALGNSIALPFWEFLAARMTDFLKSEGIDKPTMASLFDGIGGFPLVYSRHGCRPVWASEIEEFPIAVTKMHFSESEEFEEKAEPTRPRCDRTQTEKPDKCLNSWDVQSKHVQTENGIAETLWSGESRRGGGESYILTKARTDDNARNMES